MMHRLTFAMLLGTALVAPAFADVDVVIENFDSYLDDTAFQTAWVETIGNGSAAANPADHNSAILTSDSTTFPGLQGQAADHIGATASSPGMVNQWGGIINQGNGQNPAFSIAPSSTQSVVLGYDMYDGASGNERMTVGLRHISVSGATVTTNNLVELGLYNSNSADPFDPGDWGTTIAQNATVDTPGFYNGRGYGARLAIFGPISEPLQHGPDWQYFRTEGETWGGEAVGGIGIAAELDRDTDLDDFVSIADIGAGWHRFEATITPDTVTFTIDFFRDGLRNTSTTPDEFGVRPGSPGVDAKLVFPIATNSVGFNSLRIGGPSGLLSAGPGATLFDNISLRLVDVQGPTENADFDGDGDVDGKDFLIWQRGVGTPDALPQDGDANLDNVVDGDDLVVWQNQYGTGALAAAIAVPEPTSVLLLAGIGVLFAAKRR